VFLLPAGNVINQSKPTMKNQFTGSVQKQGIREAPVCNDCHNEHNIQAINTSDKKLEIKKLTANKTCMICHGDPRLTERFGVSGDKTKQYEDSYHGLAVMRGDKNAAMCIDCHGVHKILPKDHPESKVNPANVTATCRKCHENATEIFWQEVISHKTLDNSASKIENFNW